MFPHLVGMTSYKNAVQSLRWTRALSLSATSSLLPSYLERRYTPSVEEVLLHDGCCGWGFVAYHTSIRTNFAHRVVNRP